MFDTFKNFVKVVINKLFNKDLIQQKTNVSIAVSNDMSNAIDLWTKLYMDEAPWVNNKTIFSMNTAAGIASEFARLVTLEFKSEISNNEFLNKEYQVVVDNIRNYTEFACAKGGLVFKPYLNGDHIEIDLVQADAFFPTAYNSRGEITGIVFIETKVIGEYTYSRLEYHNLSKDGYLIKNSAFKNRNYNQVNASMNQTLGQEIPLAEVDDWAQLEPEVTITNVDKPLFSYFKMPLANAIDPSSPLGVSVYARVSKDLLKKVDEQWSRILWEYEGSELGIDIDSDMLKRDESGNSIMPQGKERLYRKFDIDPNSSGTSQWNIFSPEIRDSSLFNGLNQLIRKVEFLCGLAYGTLSDPNDTDKTAEEIKSSKQRSYQTVKDIQKALKNALEGLAYAMSVWGQLGGLSVSPVDVDKDMSFDFDDSIVVDKEKELAGMQADVSSGLLRPEIYLAKKYGISEEEALKMMPDTSTTIRNSPFEGTVE
ncbi:phage portal protein [Clostridium sp. 'White wine YQ']|uniref:phage portal protein n=1 Tax=Clostridium sp. 'White wine YQ' TaxID=3027474 RepID=UPI002365539D|nr:phage portal protein [Clostridium sp. 'White wine YQ']MDD7793684.1 phage portal protein [Clostridium sp. 'White wine YQ']